MTDAQPPSPAKPKNGLATAALILGFVAFLMAFAPGASFLAWIPAMVAITLGLISFAKRKEGRKKALGGVALSALGWLIAVVVSIATIGAAVTNSNKVDTVAAPSPSVTQPPSEEPLDEEEPTGVEEAFLDPEKVITPGYGPSVAVADTTATNMTALALLATLPVKGRAPKTGYERSLKFGPAWLDVDHNGCDTRNDMLARDLTATTLSGPCRVLSGSLADPYTGKTISFVRGNTTSTAVQIDHLVPLMNAWETGAQQLTHEQRVAFANDPINLLAVDGPTNSKKGAGDAATWLPAQKSFRCEYVARQVSVKATYGLWVTTPERDAIANVLSACPDQPALTSPFTPAPPPPPPPPAPVAPPPAPVAPAPVAPAPPSSAYYKNCTAARAAGAAPVRLGDPGYGRHLDRDGDGVGCE